MLKSERTPRERRLKENKPQLERQSQKLMIKLWSHKIQREESGSDIRNSQRLKERKEF